MSGREDKGAAPGAWVSALVSLEEACFGHCGIGRVESVEGGICGVAAGNRVVWFGREAADAFFVAEPMLARVPDSLSDGAAAWAGPAAMGLQAIRQSELTFGESARLTGTGPLADLISQLLRKFGCYVLDGEAGGPCDGVFLCGGGAAGSSVLSGLRRGGCVVLLDDQPAPPVPLGSGIRVVFPAYPEREPGGFCDPPGYARWTLKQDLVLCLQLIEEGALRVPAEIEPEAGT